MEYVNEESQNYCGYSSHKADTTNQEVIVFSN